MMKYIKASLGVILVALLLVSSISLTSQMESGSKTETLSQMELAVKQACVTCYALEGRYPPNLEYMSKNYGIAIDENRYIVLYQVFGQNIMPMIKIMEA